MLRRSGGVLGLLFSCCFLFLSRCAGGGASRVMGLRGFVFRGSGVQGFWCSGVEKRVKKWGGK